MATDERFPSPFEIPPPAGAEGWRAMYDWYHLFDEDRRAQDEQRFWFQDRLHHPEAMHPYDEIQSECWWQALGAFNTRVFAMPPAFGVDQRIVNGYLYVSAISAPPEQLEQRAAEFARRAGFYYEHWDELYDAWKAKVGACFDRISAVEFAPLPELEPESTVFEHVGHSAGYRMIRDFNELVMTMYETYQYHFEFLNIGYAAYLTFFDFCKQSFPDIADQAIARMVAGLSVDLYRPDDELKRLAKEAERLGVGNAVIESATPAALFATLAEGPEAGRAWLADWNATSDPWFLVSTDPGHPGGYHTYPTWQEAPAIPLATVREYILRLRRGETIDRPTAQVVAERERITGEYRALLDPAHRPAFDELVALARRVFAYIEEHVLYIEHWMWATFWMKSRQLARTLVEMGYFHDDEDLFFLRRTEVAEALYDAVAGWSVGSRPRGMGYWGPILAERRRIYEALRAAPAPPALGPPPEAINEPLTVMLWGITTETVREWAAQRTAGTNGTPSLLRGFAASPGVVEGRARIVRHVGELDAVGDGEILVCSATSPSWSTIFGRIAGTVSDVGGIMSHTAIVCREYGLPAVVGVGSAVATLQDGQRIRVDGDHGVVTVLE